MKQPKSYTKNTSANRIGCIIMASGLSRRFGRNKLFVEYEGKTFLQRALEATERAGFSKRIVVTRTPEAVDVFPHVIFHDMPGRNDAVRLGVEALADMDGWLFCPCDQPLLRQESVAALVEAFCEEGNPEAVYRLAWKGKPGSPVLFGKAYFDELISLPEKKGGGYVISCHPDAVRFIEAEDSMELFDVDTEEDYKQIRMSEDI